MSNGSGTFHLRRMSKLNTAIRVYLRVWANRM